MAANVVVGFFPDLTPNSVQFQTLILSFYYCLLVAHFENLNMTRICTKLSRNSPPTVDH